MTGMSRVVHNLLDHFGGADQNRAGNLDAEYLVTPQSVGFRCRYSINVCTSMLEIRPVATGLAAICNELRVVIASYVTAVG